MSKSILELETELLDSLRDTTNKVRGLQEARKKQSTLDYDLQILQNRKTSLEKIVSSAVIVDLNIQTQLPHRMTKKITNYALTLVRCEIDSVEKNIRTHNN